MNGPTRTVRVRFIDENLYQNYRKLESGRHEEQELAQHLRDAIEDLKKNPLCGVKVPRQLWPKEYIQKYHIDNLRKYNLSKGWRLSYTLVGNEVEIISVLLEWFDHKNYEKRFGYKVQ